MGTATRWKTKMARSWRTTGRRRGTILVAAQTAIALVVTLAGHATAAPATPSTSTPVRPQDAPGAPAHDLRGKPPVTWTADGRTLPGPRQVSWPAAGEVTIEMATIVSGSAAEHAAVGSDRTRPATSPVRIGRVVEDFVSQSRTGAGPARATVRVLDRTATSGAGVDGLLFSVKPDDGSRAEKVTVTVDYSQFAHAFGGDWASRLRLHVLGGCAVNESSAAVCGSVTPLATDNDTRMSTVTADLKLAGSQETFLAVQSTASGDNGDYTATDLAQAGTWRVGTQTGDFVWDYPLRTPPGQGGPEPQLSLGYSSGSIDGRTGTTNNQAGWVGDGWEFSPGHIERKYASCADDNPSHKTGDLCWFSNNATLSLAGHAGELIETGTPNVFRLKNDTGARIEKLTDAARGNGDNDNEYWKVTVPDGTQYFFGYHKLPNWASGNSVTDSVWTVPVYGNNPGEPCYNATFANAWCPGTNGQAWRWNLDYVVDPHDNTMAYFYGKESGWYGRDNNASQRTEYVRSGWPDRIEYGTRKGSEYASAAPMKVTFTSVERCLSGCWTGTAWTSDPVKTAWPDTPWDLHCAAAPCTGKLSPTFFQTRRLTKVTAQLRSGATSYRDVESWTLRHEFLNPGGNESTPLWLRGITRTGHVTTAEGIQVSDPEVVFDPGSDPLPNRVDRQDGRTLLARFRIKTITTESGGQIGVTYSGPGCTKDSLPEPHNNSTRCMPVYYAPTGTPTLDWFHRYVVTSVNQHDVVYTTAGGGAVDNNPDQTTYYDYLDAPAWHYTTDEITPDKYRTWGDWRGYGRIQVRTGSSDGQQTAVEHRYLRGMDGDKQPTGVRDVWVSDTWGGSIEDHEALSGFTRQTITLNGPDGAEVSSVLNEPWRNGPTATRTRAGITANAWMTNSAVTRTRVKLENGNYRIDSATVGFNADGLPVTAEASGDEAVTGDETCTRTTYARNDTTWMIDRVAQVEILSVPCGQATTPAAKETVLSRTRTFYETYVDESSFGQPPTKGDVVRVEELGGWNGSTPLYARVNSKTYDEYGGVLDSFDANGNKSTTAYGIDAATGLLTSNTVTNALGHSVVTLVEPAWQLPTKITDTMGAVTDMTYDGLGRRTNVWLPGRNKAANQSASTKYTYDVRSGGNPTAVTTETLLPNGNAYLKSVTLLDGFLRERQVQTQATGGGRTLKDTLHNALGFVAWTSDAYYDTTGAAVSATLAGNTQRPSVTEFAYDGTGRKTADILRANGAEKWRTTTIYGGDRVHIVPPEGGTATTTILDVRGQARQLRQYKSPADVASPDPTKYDATSYTYNLTRKLESVTDAAGNTWSFKYDLRGRQIERKDPDTGTITFTHDDAGHIATVTTPSTTGSGTVTIAYTYDAAGRKTTLRDDNASGTIRAKWEYDETLIMPQGVNKAKGKPTSSTRYVNGNAYTTRIDGYDVYGRPTSSSVELPATETQLCAAAAPNTCTYTTAFTYRPNGVPSSTTLPAAANLASERLTFGYTDVGEPASMYSASQIYVDSVLYDKVGQLKEIIYGADTLKVSTVRDFDPFTRRLSRVRVMPNGKPQAADFEYSYDGAGNLQQLTDTPEGQPAQNDNQCFDYDYARRLTEAWTPLDGDCQATRSVAALGGPAPYWRSWTFDSIGNRRTETQHEGTATTLTYTYPASGPGSARPHAVSQISATGGQTWTRGYTYDNAGNTRTQPGQSGTQTLTFDREGKVSTLVEGSNTTSAIYDADGNRLIRKDPNGSKTLYLTNTEVRFTAGGTTTATRYYGHSGATIATRTAAGLNWIVNDQHGTATVTVNAATLVAAKRRTQPYGQQRGGLDSGWPTSLDKGFVGGTNDPTGLTHIGAREYDQSIGRFISPDPVVDFTDPQQLHAYAYGKNAPTTFADPDGKKPYEDGDGGRPWYTKQHNTAAEAALQVIRRKVVERGGRASDVTLEYRIDGASKKKTGNTGKADIVWDNGDEIYVWEVKALGQGDDLAQKELAGYREDMAKLDKYKGKSIQPGFKMNAFAVGIVPDSPGRATYVIAFDGPTEGTILYITRRIDPPKQPEKEPVKEPKPIPMLNPEPRTVQVPQPLGQPNPIPGIAPYLDPNLMIDFAVVGGVILVLVWIAYGVKCTVQFGNCT